MCVAVTCLALTASSAYGKSATGVILDECGGVFPSNVVLEDNDKSYIVTDVADGAGALGTLSVGDILRGMYTVQNVKKAPPGTPIGSGTAHNELTAVFDIKVTNVWAPNQAGHPGSDTNKYFWLFGPDAGFGGYLGDAGMPAVPVNTMVMVFDDPAQDYTDDNVAIGQEENLIATAANGPLWGAFGMVPGGPAEFWWTDASTNSIAVISGALAPPGGPVMASGVYALSLIPTGGLADTLLVPDPTQYGTELTGNLALYGVKNPDGSLASNNFDFISDSDLGIRVVPTPMAIWAAMPLFGLGAFIIKRRLVC